MARGKVSDARPKNQPAISSFFGKTTKQATHQSSKYNDDQDIIMEDVESKQSTTSQDIDYLPDEDSEKEGDAVSEESDVIPAELTDAEVGSDVEEDTLSKPQRKGRSNAPDASSLPPISDIPSIFADLVGRIPEIKAVAEHVQGESYVLPPCALARKQIQKVIMKQHNIKLEVEHVFSCEIEPFKQAYIERNFQPPILFRDVCELGDAEAHTAYGALTPVPGDVDLLVAGTSCVDYSNLNNEKQDIDDNGESGRTFRGMMSWVKNHRPPLVILENVCSAPWSRVQEKFEKIGYSAAFKRVDTKQYYIPHTRTRVYLVAVNKKSSRIPKDWENMVLSKLQRPASSTLDAFLLPSDDPRIHQARQKLVQESYGALDRKTGRTDWSRCESRHQRARLEEALGSKRPLTNWDDGGFCKLPDFAWNDWGVGQVERVWDLMDISLLRSAKKGVDPSYKTQVWNLSQNVDRTIASGRPGICPCLTPSMIPYITNRGGPMVGLEALSMQGLPVDKLLLTRESEDQLADLAGNAMSTTVVGACILAVLVCGKSLLRAGDDEQTYESKGGQDECEAMVVDTSDELVSGNEIVGEDELLRKPLDLSVKGSCSLHELLTDAERSVRLCSCEGRMDETSRELFRCIDCGISSCKKCGGRPEHNPQLIDIAANPRLHPSTFSKTLKSTLPMCLLLSGIDFDFLESLKKKSGVNIPDERWGKWSKAVRRAATSEFRFVELKRQEIWSVIYQSSTAHLHLFLHAQQPEWRLYALPDPDEPANAEIRQTLAYPVGRLSCRSDILVGHWSFALPFKTTVEVKIKGVGDLVPSWEARLGLMSTEFKNKQVFSKLKITVSSKDVKYFDRDISGDYILLDKCGTANGALHKKMVTPGDGDLPPLFMLFDPHRTDDSEDAFVFSISTRRLEYQEPRPIIAKLDPSWRQSSTEDVENISCNVPVRWIEAESVRLQPSVAHDGEFGVPRGIPNIPTGIDSCCHAYALLACTVSLRGQAGPEWPLDNWVKVDKVHERATFKALSWLLERVRNIDDSFHTWWNVDADIKNHSNCERCAPTAPALRWMLVNKKMVPTEDPVQAGEYERRLKARPLPFVTELKLQKDGVGHVRIGLNIPSLLHRAYSRLPTIQCAEKPTLSWRLDTNFSPSITSNFSKFVLSSNKNDEEHQQPPSFKIPLRKEQLRSLGWMLKQESSDAPPFIEEEISEAISEPLGWRAEGRAQRPACVRGGVLADQVGYGKTAITLGLIDCASASVNEEFSGKGRIPGKISVKGTLIVVPPHLIRQWKSEVEKFTKKRFKVALIGTVSNLNSTTIEDIQKADIIVVASNIFKSNVYLDNLQLLAAAGDMPSREGRHFNAHLESVLKLLGSQTDRLQDEGSLAVLKYMKESRKRAAEEAATEALAQSKRLKGKAYRDAAQEQKNAQAGNGLLSSQSLPQNKTSGTARPTRSGLIPVVDIPPFERRKSQPSSSVNSEAEIPRKRKRAAANRSVYNGSDSDGSSCQPMKSSKQLSKKRKLADGSTASSDFDDDNSGATSDAPAPPPTSDEEEVRVDTKGQKGKAKSKSNGGKNAPKKTKRTDSDSWKLASQTVQKDWTEMQAPPLEMFHFARKVVDEYTYLDGKVHSLVTSISSDRHWVLSGTPPIHDFAALKTIAAFLNIHLGVDDDGEGQSVEVKKRRREQTAVERFHSFREVHSLEWHAHRHQVGQTFLDQFVRQNIAEIDEIPWTEKVESITLPAAERAIYLELEHHLRALDMNIKRGKKNESDREKRLGKSLRGSKTAEEALLKSCSHFELDGSTCDNALKACDIVVRDRQKQLDECKADLLKAIEAGIVRERKLGNVGQESMFNEYIRVTRTEGVDDHDATTIANGLLDIANAGNGKAKGKGQDTSLTEKVKAAVWDHREKTHEIRRLTKELVGRVRSLRYFTAVRDLQKHRENPLVVRCPACGNKNVPINEVGVLSTCGHMGCMTCVRLYAEKEECVYAVSGACKSSARLLNVVKGDTLGVDDATRNGEGKHFGCKIENVIHLVKKDIPNKERVLIFVQFPDLMKTVGEALAYHKIDYLEIRGTAHQKSKNLEQFQNGGKERVLLLNVMDESASGANLTCANHAIFLSPLLAPSMEIYTACETQAIGRLVRYGQTKHVHVWRFLVANTIDEEIYTQRKAALDKH
ncbi:hypothetical protein BDQ17DRAFT_1352752 [Cyathus striatus]|nr:hypothetical protein BDQ17DRAFT_1352752 [Cyathus striatus]